MLSKYIGDRSFYRRVFQVAIPIIIQNGITNFVSLLDNIMVGQVGTLPMIAISLPAAADFPLQESVTVL